MMAMIWLVTYCSRICILKACSRLTGTYKIEVHETVSGFADFQQFVYVLAEFRPKPESLLVAGEAGLQAYVRHHKVYLIQRDPQVFHTHFIHFGHIYVDMLQKAAEGTENERLVRLLQIGGGQLQREHGVPFFDE